MAHNNATKQTEWNDEEVGRWYASGGEKILCGERLHATLVETYHPTHMEAQQFPDGKMKLVPARTKGWGDSIFCNDDVLRKLAHQAAINSFAHYQPLDYNTKLVPFANPMCLDFGKPTEHYPRRIHAMLKAMTREQLLSF